MRWGSAYALFACVACSISGPALAQNTTGGGTPPAAATPAPDNKLPPVEVIQKQAQPAPKAIQTAGASQEEDRAAGAPARACAAATRRSNRARHGRHRHRHRPDVAGAGQLDSNQQVPGRRRPGLGQRHRSREAALRAGAAAADGAERAHQRRAGQHLSARSAVPRLRGFARQRRGAGHRRLSERRAHQRELRRHRQLGLPAR